MSYSKTIGIIGGGQLGQMMAISAIYRGHKVIALDPQADCPASRVAEIIVADYHDVAALHQLAERCDVLTYEFENVNADALDAVVADGQLPQGTDLLRISQNRIAEKAFLSEQAGVTVAPYRVVTSSRDLDGLDLSKKYVLKTATGGYDGHGQVVIKGEENLADARQLADSADCVLEEFVNFDLEISVIVSGNGSDVVVFPVQENSHRNNILSKTVVPARISEDLAEKAKDMAIKIAKQLNLSGTLCVEMFATADDIMVNEIAPRPHNSGHYSIEACNFSQFDTHILGVLGQPLPEITLHTSAVMLNVLGQHMDQAQEFCKANPQAHLHLYGKAEAKHNRKMGHVTVVGSEDEEELSELIDMKIDIQEGTLFVNDNEIADFSSKNLEFIELLGEGANGYTFLVRHKILDINQVVKIYKSSDIEAIEKAIGESKKNSEPILGEVVARVYDAGILDMDVGKKVYSIMDFIGSSLTLKQLLWCRDYAYGYVLQDLEHPNRMEYLEKHFIQEAINISVSFLYSLSKLLKSEITHGDLNPNNIFLKSSYYSTELHKSIKEKQIPIDNNIMYCSRPGSINSSEVPVTFIDLGTSNIKGTDRDIGNRRDSYFVFDTIRRLIKPLFRGKEGVSLKTYMNFKVENNDIIFSKEKPYFIHPITLAGELLRFLMFTNLILNLQSVDGEELSALNSLVSGRWNPSVSNLGLDIFDTRVQEAYEYYMNSDKQSYGKLINWESYVNFLENSFQGKEFLKAEITNGNLRLN